VAVCDVKGPARQAAKRAVDSKYGNQSCATYIDLRELLARPDIDAVLIATGPNWHGLAACLAARAGKDIYCEKPCTKTISDALTLAEVIRRTGRVFQAGTQRRSLPGFAFAVELARSGKLGKLQTMHAHPLTTPPESSGWLPAEAQPPREEIDWDIFLGPAAWRPYAKGNLRSFNFEEGGGMVGGGTLPWGSHTVDICQWANNSDLSAPIEYWPENSICHARYANGVTLVMRDTGWIETDTCPVRFEGDAGWVETSDSGNVLAQPGRLLAGRFTKVAGYPANPHIQNFLQCVKTRGIPRASADVACQSHIACHAANIALFLNRKVRWDPKTNAFLDDEQANRLRSEALRDPWRMG
jgi:hypothetical protein